MAINLSHLLAVLLFVLAFSSSAVSAKHQVLTLKPAMAKHVISIDKCAYKIAVETGSHKDAATNSTITVIMTDNSGDAINIRDLASWKHWNVDGLPPFRRESVDIFRGESECLDGLIKSVTLISDGEGTEPGWYVGYVQVSRPEGIQTFGFYQWLSINDPPYELSATRTYKGSM